MMQRFVSGLSRNFSIVSRFHSSKTFPEPPEFKSALSLDNIFPNSSPNDSNQTGILKSEKNDTFRGYIPMDKVIISATKSAGPGGSNVNAVNSKATVKFHLETADWIPQKAKSKLQELHKNNINKEGFWQIRSGKTRSHSLNVADCLDKFRCYIAEACIPERKPSLEVMEQKRERQERAAAERLREKRIRSTTKSERRVNVDF